jgi:sulfatase maturation enzyme AslB (radical SAM superfamily)
MKIPNLVLFNVRGKTIAFSPKFFEFELLPDYPMNTPILLLGDDSTTEFAHEVHNMNPSIVEMLNDTNEDFKPSNVNMIYVNSTNVCRGGCTYCYAMPVMINGNKVTFASLMMGIESIDSVDTLETIVLLGGDPLLNQELIEDIIEKTKYNVSLSTGLFITENEFKRFKQLLIKHKDRIVVQCSIDPTNKYRPGKHGEGIFDKAIELAKLTDMFKIRATLCTDDIDYRSLRKIFEDATSKQIDVDFEIVTDINMMPTMEEWYKILSNLIMDAQEYIDGTRKEIPLSISEFEDTLVEHYDTGDKNFLVDFGCGIFEGASPVFTPEGNFQRCTQPPKENDYNWTVPPKCQECPILRYCGVSCPVEAGHPPYCATQLARILTGIYIMLWRSEKWK